MNVVRIAFPGIHLLTASYTSGAARTESHALDDVAGIASGLGLRDSRWRPTRGPQPRTGTAVWLRGDLGGIACLVERSQGSLLHVMRRDGSPVAIVRRVAERGGRSTAA